MARKKKVDAAKEVVEETMVEETVEEKVAVEEKKTEGVAALKKPRKKFESRNPPIFIDDIRSFGTAAMFTKPDYVPPDIEIAWALAPSRDDGVDLGKRFAEGYDFVTDDMITDDIGRAKSEGLICLKRSTMSSIGTIDAGIGLTNHGLILLFRPKEVGEKIRKSIFTHFNDMVNAYVADRRDEVKAQIERNQKYEVKYKMP